MLAVLLRSWWPPDSLVGCRATPGRSSSWSAQIRPHPPPSFHLSVKFKFTIFFSQFFFLLIACKKWSSFLYFVRLIHLLDKKFKLFKIFLSFSWNDSISTTDLNKNYIRIYGMFFFNIAFQKLFAFTHWTLKKKNSLKFLLNSAIIRKKCLSTLLNFFQNLKFLNPASIADLIFVVVLFLGFVLLGWQFFDTRSMTSLL